MRRLSFAATLSAAIMVAALPAAAFAQPAAPSVTFSETCAFVLIDVQTSEPSWLRVEKSGVSGGQEQYVVRPHAFREIVQAGETVQAQLLSEDRSRVLVEAATYERKTAVTCTLPLVQVTAVCQDDALIVSLVNRGDTESTPVSLFTGETVAERDVTVAAKTVRHFVIPGVAGPNARLTLRYGPGGDVQFEHTRTTPDHCGPQTGPGGQPMPAMEFAFTDLCGGAVRVETEATLVYAEILRTEPDARNGYVYPPNTGGVTGGPRWPGALDIEMKDGELVLMRTLPSGETGRAQAMAAHVFHKRTNCGSNGQLPVTGGNPLLPLALGLTALALGATTIILSRRRAARLRALV